MKRILSFFVLASVLLASSCSLKEDFKGNDSEFATISLTLGGPESSATRAIGDGSSVDLLHYAVYDSDDQLIPALGKVVEVQKFPTQVDITLAKGQTYKIAFWAQNQSTNAYKIIDGDVRHVEIDYAGYNNNDESRDAFFKTIEHTVTGDIALDVVLERPFAQINLGVTAEDWAAAETAGISVKKSKVKISNAASALDLFSGQVGAGTEVVYEFAEIPALSGEILTVEEVAYKYLSMNYILVNSQDVTAPAQGLYGEGKELVNAEFTLKMADAQDQPVVVKVDNLPVQRNWRTNVIGRMLTGDISFNISLDPIFDGEEIYPDTLEEELLFAALNGGKVTLTDNVVLDKPLTISNGKSMLIDLAGWTISSEKECTASYSLIVNNGTLTIKDSKENGKITFKDLGQGGGSTFGSYVIENRGLLIINGGTIEHQGTINALDQHNTNIPIQNYAGKVIVNKGKIVSKDFRSLRDFTAGGQIEINGGIFEGQVWMQGLGTGSTSLTIKGGEFSPLAGYDGSSIYLTNGTNVINLSITGGTFATRVGCANPEKEGVKGSIKGGVYGDNTNLDKLVADGYTYAYDGEWYTVSKGERVQTVEDFRDALNDSNQDVVVLGSDLDISNETYAWLNINREVVINTENNKLEVGNSANYGIFCNSGADVIFENVNILSNGGGIVVRDGASVEFNGNSLAIESPSTSQRYLFYAYGENTTITINDGVFSFEQYKKRGYGYIASGAKMYIKGGSFGIASNHPNDPTAPLIADGGEIIITGGTFGFNPTAWVADGYEAVQLGSTWTVEAK